MKDYQHFWDHRWISPKARSSNSSIHGLGIIAIQNILKGEVVGVLGGIVIPRSEIKKYRQKLGHIGIQIDDQFFICPSSREELLKTGVFNHSCNPNVGFKNSLTLVAINNIKTNEELVFDYSFSETDFKQFNCSCGDINCRKIIKPTDWKVKTLQKKFKNYFSPYIKAKF